jgi:hypothetical protein
LQRLPDGKWRCSRRAIFVVPTVRRIQMRSFLIAGFYAESHEVAAALWSGSNTRGNACRHEGAKDTQGSENKFSNCVLFVSFVVRTTFLVIYTTTLALSGDAFEKTFALQLIQDALVDILGDVHVGLGFRIALGEHVEGEAHAFMGDSGRK